MPDTGYSTTNHQLRKHIDDMIKACKCHNSSKNYNKRQAKASKKGEYDRNERPLTIQTDPTMEQVPSKRSRIRKIRAIPSTTHGMLKFPVEGGTVTLQSSRIILMECAMIFGPSTWPAEAGKILEEKIRVAIHSEYPEQTIAIESTLTEKGRKELCTLLGQNLDGCPLVRQKKRGQAPERNKAIQEEVEKLVDARIMKEFSTLVGYLTQATYQRLVDKAFQRQIGRNLEVYVDDLVIKIRTEEEIIRDITETFKTIRQINMKMNPKKCSFGMQEEMFLGYKVNTDGLKLCPEKADVILSLPSPRCLKDIQELNGKLASLNRFLSKSAEKSLPFFKTLKKCKKRVTFPWTQERSSHQTKEELVAELRMLTAPKEKEELIVYLAAAKEAISAVLMTDRRSLNDRKGRQAIASVLCEPCPTRAEDQLHLHGKIGISLAQRKQTAEKVLPEGCDIQYRPRTSIKGQILADFIMVPEEGVEFTYAMRFRFEATNNEAEYEALIAGLRIAEQMGVKNLQANVDSRLVANQINGSYIAKESGMVQYLEKVKTLASNFKEFSIKQVPRSENKKAYALRKIASTRFAHLSKQVLVEELKEKSIHEMEVLAIVEEKEKTWMTPICEYLTKEILLEDKKKARVVRRKASRYTIINGTLYKKYFLGPWLLCVRPLQANYVLREIHEGSCSMHSGPRSVVAKAIQTGYYWPTMHTDVRKLIRECNDCQVHRPILRNPQQNLTPVTSLWPFYKWGIDIAGPFPEGPGKVKFLIVAIHYFTKWIEAKPVATITGNQVKKFVWDNIVCRFGLPGEIVSDNGKQFRDNPFKDCNDASHAKDGGKLGPKWEGPYEVTESLGKGDYKLKDRNGNKLPRT
ncbi:reverse transcriptase domain-containing protein [Tanacetum coccineum]|uniref:Reverse transcriptase domain-containing protein n=1 Tax=Tanacetum coccineum TaxID=301880 RepID=A0ABQ5ED36_9ASTR